LGPDLDIVALGEDARVLLDVLQNLAEPVEIVGAVAELVDLARLPGGKTGPDAILCHEHRQLDRWGLRRRLLCVVTDATGLDVDLGELRPDRRQEQEGDQHAHHVDEGDEVDVDIDLLPLAASSTAREIAGHVTPPGPSWPGDGSRPG